MTAARVDRRWYPSAAPQGRPVVVLLGSLGSNLTMWDPQLEELGAAFDLLRVEHRGHGSSPPVAGNHHLDDLTGDLLAVLDEEGVDQAHLVGISLGGMVAMNAALQAPQRVASVAVVCSSARLGPASGWTERADRVLHDGPGVVAEDIVGRWFTDAFATRHPQVVADMVAMIAATDRVGYAGCCHAIATMDLRDRLPSLQVPLLAIAAGEDHTTPPEHLQEIAALAPDARYELIAGAHLVTMEDPGTVNRLLLAHLRTAAPDGVVQAGTAAETDRGQR